jgi:hypothetical protein
MQLFIKGWNRKWFEILEKDPEKIVIKRIMIKFKMIIK